MGREPCIAKDVHYIIKNMPALYMFRNFMASYLIFAVETGARISSCLKIQLSDIIKYEETCDDYMKLENGLIIRQPSNTSSDNNKSQVLIINIKFRKGSRNTYHPVTYLNIC
jgi:hypothetical protein